MKNRNNDKEIVSHNREIFDGEQDARSFISAADSASDLQEKIDLYTNALLSTSDIALEEEALFKRGSVKLEHASTFKDFDDAMKDLLAGAGPEYGRVDNTIFRKVGILVQGGVGETDLFTSSTEYCTKW